MNPALEFVPGVFNLTMTYRLDSDIFFAYSELIDIKTNVPTAPKFHVDWRVPDKDFAGF
jgi:alpha-1,3-fucosyltransferase